MAQSQTTMEPQVLVHVPLARVSFWVPNFDPQPFGDYEGGFCGSCGTFLDLNPQKAKECQSRHPSETLAVYATPL